MTKQFRNITAFTILCDLLLNMYKHVRIRNVSVHVDSYRVTLLCGTWVGEHSNE